jgi:hypothetical protein
MHNVLVPRQKFFPTKWGNKFLYLGNYFFCEDASKVENFYNDFYFYIL